MVQGQRFVVYLFYLAMNDFIHMFRCYVASIVATILLTAREATLRYMD